MLLHDNRLLQWLEREREKKQKGRFYDFLYFVLFFPISLVCQETTPRWCFTTVLIVVFVWVSAYFLGLKVRCSELVQREKEKKKWRYILCYINVEKFLLFFFPVFFFLPLLKVAEVSINFYWNVLGVLWNAFTPTLPKVPGRMEGLKDIYPSSAFLLPPIPFPILRRFSWKEPVRTSRDGAVWIVGGEIRVLSKLFNVPFSVFTPLLYQVDPEANKSPLLMEQY